MDKCSAKNRVTQEPICERNVWDQHERRCIFHCNNKPADQFKVYFQREVASLLTDKFDGREFIFPAQIQFDDMVFKTEATFEGARFGDNFVFGENTVFEQNSTFRNTQFGNRISFEKVTFKGKVNFQNADFGERACFDGARFKNWAVFNIVTFKDFPSFRSVHFDYKLSFEGGSVFGNNASFIFTEFGDEVFFSRDVKFEGSADFSKTIFRGKVRFDKMQCAGILDFRDMTFEKPSQVVFYKLDLSQTQIVGSNVQDIDFRNCLWPEDSGRPKIGDEIEFNNSDPKTPSLKEVEKLYL